LPEHSSPALGRRWPQFRGAPWPDNSPFVLVNLQSVSLPEHRDTIETRTMVTAPFEHDAVPSSSPDIVCKVADTLSEKRSAFELIYEAYLCTGLGEPNPFGVRITPYHLLPTTDVFIAVHQGEVVLTFTLVGDGDLGLPIESVYGEEVARLRQRGVRCAEVSCLADRRKQLNGEFFSCFIELSRMVVQYSHRRGLDGLLVAAHPKHGRFYRRLMGFTAVGGEKSYPAVRNRPAVALYLDFAGLPKTRPDCHKLFFDNPFPSWQLRSRPISKTERSHFEPMIAPSYAMMLLGEADEFSRVS
jgi:hypothetical protein